MRSIVPEEPFQISQEKCFLAPNPPLLLFSARSLPRGIKWSSDIDAPVKTIVRRFQRREIALASLIYVKTRFFSPSFVRPKDASLNRFQIPPTSSRVARRLRRRLGKPIQHVCAELGLVLRQLSGKL